MKGDARSTVQTMVGRSWLSIHDPPNGSNRPESPGLLLSFTATEQPSLMTLPPDPQAPNPAKAAGSGSNGEPRPGPLTSLIVTA